MRTRGLLATAIVASLALAQPATGAAATIAVTTGADELNTVPSTCSLREAVQAANTNAVVDACSTGVTGADTIVLAGGTTYARSITGSNEQANATGDLDILAGEPVTIQVSGFGTVTISGTGTPSGDRVIDNFADGTEINSVEIANGEVASQGGGGIRSSGTLTIRNSALIQNTAGSFGGGIANDQNDSLTATNVTIFDNEAGETGGGIDTGSGSTLALNNVSIVGNSAGDTVDPEGAGGGFYAFSFMTTVTLSNSIVQGNVDDTPSSTASDCGASTGPTITSQGYNLIGSLAGCPFTPVAGDLTGTSAGLGPLSENGGSTRTLPLTSSSPAYNAGNNVFAPGSGGAACAATDQRGVIRPQFGRCDIGAFELAPTPFVSGPTGTCPQTFGSSRLTCPPAPGQFKAPAPKCKKKKGKKAGAAAKKKGCKKPKKRKK